MRFALKTLSKLSVLALATLAVSGCDSTPSSPHPVEPVKARETLEAVLTSWQEGAAIESWRDHEPEVVVQDLDWETGKELESFEILDDGNAMDAILRCEVRLTVTDSETGSSEKTVTYQVGTSPVITVFRE